MGHHFVTSALVLEQVLREVMFLSNWTGRCRILHRAQCFQGWQPGCIRLLQPWDCAFKSRWGRQQGFSLLVQWELTWIRSLEDLEPSRISTAGWLFDPAALSGLPFPHSLVGDEGIWSPFPSHCLFQCVYPEDGDQRWTCSIWQTGLERWVRKSPCYEHFQGRGLL